jgi:hypothetical protein
MLTASSGDLEQGPIPAPTLLMTQFAMLETRPALCFGRWRRGRGGRMRIERRETEGCLSEKISILISAEGSTAGRGLFLQDAAALRSLVWWRVGRRMGGLTRCSFASAHPIRFESVMTEADT